MVRLKYDDSPKEGIVNTIGSPLDLNHVMIINGIDIEKVAKGSGSILSFKLDPFETRITEIKVISAAHVYTPLFEGGMTDNEYERYSKKNSGIMRFYTSLSQKWLVTGDPSGVITPATILNDTTHSLYEIRGWRIGPAYIKTYSSPDKTKLTSSKGDIVVVTYSSETGLNSEMISDGWRNFRHYRYEIPPIGTGEYVCQANCPLFFNGFGNLGIYNNNKEGVIISQRTELSLDARAYILDYDDSWVSTGGIIGKKYDPYTSVLLGEIKDVQYNGYSGSAILTPDNNKFLGILSSSRLSPLGGSTLRINFPSLITKDPVYHKWLIDNVGSV